MIEFVNNNVDSSIIELLLFFVNKDFYFRINFSFDFIFYTSTKKRLLIVKIENIIDIMQNIFNYVRNNVEIIQKRITI